MTCLATNLNLGDALTNSGSRSSTAQRRKAQLPFRKIGRLWGDNPSLHNLFLGNIPIRTSFPKLSARLLHTEQHKQKPLIMTKKTTEQPVNEQVNTPEAETNAQPNAGEAAANPEKAEAEAPETEKDPLEAALEELAALKDKYLRQVAEFDNYRKRTLKEKTDLILNGGEKVLTALLPILDDLDRAAENIEKSNDLDTLKEGVALILDKLTKTLAAQGLKKMETIGQPFDTDFHEAVALIPAQEEAQKNVVIDCVQQGYQLNDKVLRHAKVVVGQ